MSKFKYLILMCAMGCTTSHSNIEKSPPFEQVSATSEKWTAGVRGGGQGINLKIDFMALKDATLRFDSVWFEGQRCELKVLKSQSFTNPVIVNKGDKFAITATAMLPNQNDEEYNNIQPEITKAVPPIAYKGDALLRYYLNDKPFYHKVDSLTEITGPLRP